MFWERVVLNNSMKFNCPGVRLRHGREGKLMLIKYALSVRDEMWVTREGGGWEGGSMRQPPGSQLCRLVASNHEPTYR